MLLTEKSPPQKSTSLCSTIGRELSLIYLIHSNNVLSLENPVGYLKAQYPALDDVAVDFANSSTFLLFSNVGGEKKIGGPWYTPGAAFHLTFNPPHISGRWLRPAHRTTV